MDTLLVQMINHLHCIDTRDFLKNYNGEKFDLILTSPPYNIGAEYDMYKDKKEYSEYISYVADILLACFKHTADDGALAVNFGRSYQYNVPADIHNAIKYVWKYVLNIIWEKPQGAALPSSVLNFVNSKKYIPFLVNEDILIYSKDGKLKDRDITPDEIRARAMYPTNIWNINPQYSEFHPAIMPKVLVSNLINFFSSPNDLVFDPFAGLGTVLVVAKELGRQFLGCEISENYCAIGNEKLKQGLLI